MPKDTHELHLSKLGWEDSVDWKVWTGLYIPPIRRRNIFNLAVFIYKNHLI